MGILKFLDVRDISRLGAINKETQLIIDHSLKTEVITNIKAQHKKEIVKIKK